MRAEFRAGAPLKKASPLLAVLLGAGLAACSMGGLFGDGGDGIEQKVDKVVWKTRDMYVRLEKQDVAKGKTAVPNAHPVNIGSDQLRNAMDLIAIEHDPKQGAIPLFTDWELDTLSNNVSKALAEAAPDQDVTFAIIGWHKGAILLKVPKLTTGRMFYQAGQLNLIVGTAQEDVNEGDWIMTSQNADRRLDPFVPGMRSFTRQHKWKLEAYPNSGIYSGHRSDWLVLSAQSLTAPIGGYATGHGGGASQSEIQKLRAEVERLRQKMQALDGGSSPAAAAAPPPPTYPYPAQPGYAYPPQQPGYAYPPQQPGYAYPPQPAYPYGTQPAPGQAYGTYPPAPGQPPGQGGSIQQRLIVLDDLRNKGLISDAEYQQKRNQILQGY